MSQAHNPNAIGTVVPIWGGGDRPPPGASHVDGLVFAFTEADLVAGSFTAAHNLGSTYVLSRVYDNTAVEVFPDLTTAVDANTLEVLLSSFEPIPGTWHLIVAGIV